MIPRLFHRQDLVPAALIVLLPLLIAGPLLLGWLEADPLLYKGELELDLQRGPLRGVPYADPNNAYTTLALGYRAALDWLQGQVPWWNPYSGVGLPLAAEYQPAAFFPLVFLLLLPKGTVVLQLALQVIAGLGTYGLLRHMNIGRLAATAGGLLFAFNGTLAWFAHAPATAVPFLPWMLWGIERIHACTRAGIHGGWRLFAAAMAASLLAGFPETAYINGLLALAWTLVRGAPLEPRLRAPFAGRVGLGGVTGIAIAAPQVMAFLLYLGESDLGGHAGDFATAALPPMAALPTLVAPYVYGPIFGYLPSVAFADFWGAVGGYVTIVLVVAALYGVMVRRDAIAWLLLGWIVATLAKTWALEPALTLFNLIPGVTAAAFARYAHPSWELAMIVLAASGLDQIARHGVRRGAFCAAMAGALALALIAGMVFPALWPEVSAVRGLRNSALGAIAWAAATLLGVMAVALWIPLRQRARALAAVLVFDAMLMFFVPMLSNPRRATLDVAAVEFLRANLGLQRFVTLEPFQPNFGAYFGLASINHNYLPVSRRWIDWLRRHVDPGLKEVAVFNGNRPGAAQRLLENVQPYRELGVKYVVAPPHSPPFAGSPADVGPLHRVYADRKLLIYELPDARPYFEVLDARCEVRSDGRLRAVVDCAEPGTLVRRELNAQGWRITVNGAKAPMLGHHDLFQAVELPKGRSEVRFAYAPPRIGWAWGAGAIGLLALLWRRRRY